MSYPQATALAVPSRGSAKGGEGGSKGQDAHHVQSAFSLDRMPHSIRYFFNGGSKCPILILFA